MEVFPDHQDQAGCLVGHFRSPPESFHNLSNINLNSIYFMSVSPAKAIVLHSQDLEQSWQ